MVRKTHNGRPGYPGRPRDWGNRLAAAAAQLFDAECEIREPDVRGVFNATTGTYAITPGTLRFSGACGVGRDLRERVGVVSDQELATQNYQVSIDPSIDTVQVHDIVTITDAPDPQMVGQRMAVVDVVMGDLPARILYCSDDLTN